MITDIEAGKVDDGVDALGHAEVNILRTDRSGQEIAIARYHHERDRLVVLLSNVELIETGGAAVENSEAVLAPFHAEERLNDPIYCIAVAQDAVRIERVEHNLTVLVEPYVVQ